MADATVPPGIAQYMAIIQNDPIYKQTLANNAASLTQAGTELGNSVVNDLVHLGYVPDINSLGATLGLSADQVNWLKSNIDWNNVSQLVAKANAAGTTETAQLGTAHTTNLGNIKDSLAARGMLSSGALPSDMGKEAQGYTNALYNAYQGAGQAIDSGYGGYLSTEQGINTSNNNALSDAYTRALAEYPNGLPGTTPAPVAGLPDPTSPTYGGSAVPGSGYGGTPVQPPGHGPIGTPVAY